MNPESALRDIDTIIRMGGSVDEIKQVINTSGGRRCGSTGRKKHDMSMHRIFCLGSGSSMKDFDWSRLDGEHTIGCNRVFLHYPKVDELVFIDKALFDEFRDEVAAFKGVIWTNKKAIPEGYEQSNMVKIDLSVGVSENCIAGQLSGLTAFEIACLQRPDEVYLLGYDLYPGHFYEVEDPLYTPHRAEKFNMRFTQAAKKYPSVQVFNCNPLSKLECFPFRSIDEVL